MSALTERVLIKRVIPVELVKSEQREVLMCEGQLDSMFAHGKLKCKM